MNESQITLALIDAFERIAELERLVQELTEREPVVRVIIE